MGKSQRPGGKPSRSQNPSVYRGFQTRKTVKHRSAMDVAMAVIRIQSAFRAYKARKRVEMIKELPDLKAPEVKNATVKIQASFKGFQTRKKMKQAKAYDVAMAVVRIQSAYRAYQARKRVEMLKGLPNLK